MTNEEKAKEIINKFYGNFMSHYTHNEVFDRCFRARYADILETMQWKDEEHAKEKQKLIDEACKWLAVNDSYAKPTHLQVDRLKEYLNSIK